MSDIILKNFNICENIIMSDTGQPTLVNLIDEIGAKSFPALHSQLAVLTRIIGKEGKHNEKIDIIALPDNDKIAEIEQELDIKKSTDGANLYVNFKNVLFQKEGIYYIKVSVDGKILTDPKLHFIELKKIE